MSFITDPDAFIIHFFIVRDTDVYKRQASDYVHENRKPSEFLVRFIGTVARHGCTLDEVMDVFHAYSDHVHMEKTTGTGFDYLVYFEDGIPDDYRYCLSLEGEHMIYHKFTPEDYEDFGF